MTDYEWQVVEVVGQEQLVLELAGGAGGDVGAHAESP